LACLYFVGDGDGDGFGEFEIAGGCEFVFGEYVFEGVSFPCGRVDDFRDGDLGVDVEGALRYFDGDVVGGGDLLRGCADDGVLVG